MDVDWKAFSRAAAAWLLLAAAVAGGVWLFTF